MTELAARPMPVPSIVEQLRPISKAKIEHLAKNLTEKELFAVLGAWELWALPYQKLPPGDWRRWIFRAGRGTGKTFTGASTTNTIARDLNKIGLGLRGEICLWGRTHDDVRHTMIEGPSGILATAPPHFRPTWEPGNKTLRWPNGVKGRCFSSEKPEQGRGPNAAWVWADEPAHWPNFTKTWFEVIEPSLRIGWARAMLTTTPLPMSPLRELEEDPRSIVTRASTFDNAFLPKEVRELFREHYAGTRIGRQELEGDYLTENEHALWSHANIDSNRVVEAPELRRIVVAVDPAVTAHEKSDETGIVVAGIDRPGRDGRGYVLADKSGTYTPHAWAKMAIAAYMRFDADCIVVEVNNGGDLVEANIRAVDPRVKVKQVRASRGKVTRAEPVAALYERGRISHVGRFETLEEQLTTWDASKNKSPDRLDSLVWAFHELLLQNDGKAGPLSAYLT